MAADYTVLFTNFASCAIGISDIMWSVTVSAESEDHALALAIDKARALNQESGMPPHGIRVVEKDLRRLAIVRRKQS